MKNIKSIIVVLFVLLTAQIASAYYCPATGRWLSRDPIGESGFLALRSAMQTSIKPTLLPSSDRWISRDPLTEKGELNRYGFIGNNAVNNLDKFGLMKWSEVISFKDKLDAKVSKECCWFFCQSVNLQFDIKGTSDGQTIKSQAGSFPLSTCVDKVFYFWWSCYDATFEGSDNSTRQGWNPSSSRFSKDVTPSSWSEFDWFDPYHINVECAAVVVICFNGKKHAVLAQAASELSWAWDTRADVWAGPTVSTSGPSHLR